MALPSQVRNSKVLRALQADFEKYKDATGKTSNEVLASKALDFSIKFTKLLAKEAPTKEQITQDAENRGYNVIVRKRVLKKLGAIDRKGTDFRGRTALVSQRKRKGKSRLNKRALAVMQELKIRRSSVKWLAKSVAKWDKNLNKNLGERRIQLGEATTRGRKKVVGTAKGSFTDTKDLVKVSGSAFSLDKVDRSKGNLSKIALREVGRGTSKFLQKKQNANIAKSFKKIYK